MNPVLIFSYSCGYRWIGRGEPQKWLPRSPDLTPLHLFFRGYTKEVVYEDKSLVRDELLRRMMDVADRKRNPEDIRKATNSVVKRPRLYTDNADHSSSN